MAAFFGAWVVSMRLRAQDHAGRAVLFQGCEADIVVVVLEAELELGICGLQDLNSSSNDLRANAITGQYEELHVDLSR